MRATERGVGPDRLAAWGRETGRDHWVLAAAFQEQYEDVTTFATAGRGDASGYDPAELVRAAIAELDGDPELLRQERERARWLFVDEYQDTDPAQVELLDAARRRRRQPGRGRRPRPGHLRLPRRRAARHRRVRRAVPAHRRPPGRPGVARRLPPLRRGAAADQPAGRRGAARARGSTGAWRRARPPSPGAAEVHVFGSAAVEAAYLADVLRRAHLLDGLPVVADGRRRPHRRCALGPLRRALASAGVPVAVSADDLPLAGQPAVAPLLTRAERAAAGVRRRAGGRGRRGRARRAGRGGAARLPARRARPCSTSAGCGGPSGSRWPSRASTPPSAAPRWPLALGDDTLLDALPDHVAAPARRVADVLAAGRLALAQDGTRRGRAVGDVAAQRPGHPVGPGERGGRAVRCGRRPRPRRRRRPVRRRRRLRRPAAVGRRPGVRRPPVRPGAARRHAARPGRWRGRRSGC